MYGVTVSGNDLKAFQEKLGTLGKIAYRGYGFIVFHSELEWDFLRHELPDYIISLFNPECALGREIMQGVKRVSP